MLKLRYILFLGIFASLTQTKVCAMLEEPIDRTLNYHGNSFHQGNGFRKVPSKKLSFKEIPIYFDSEKKPVNVCIPHKLSQKDLIKLDMRDITTPACVPYAFKNRIFPLLKEGELDKAVLFTFAFVWNNETTNDEFYAQLRDIDLGIIQEINQGKNGPRYFSKAQQRTKDVLEHFIPQKNLEGEEIIYENPFLLTISILNNSSTRVC